MHLLIEIKPSKERERQTRRRRAKTFTFISRKIFRKNDSHLEDYLKGAHTHARPAPLTDLYLSKEGQGIQDRSISFSSFG